MGFVDTEINSLQYPIPSFRFALVAGIDPDPLDWGFQEVSGLDSQIEVEEVVCGGENRFKYKLPKTATYGNLVLRRGLMAIPSLLTHWVQTTIRSGLTEAITTKTVILSLLDANAVPVKVWHFRDAYPVKWNVSEFNSTENAIAVEMLELAYSYYTQVY